MGSRGCWHLCDHLPGGGVGASYQPRNERRLGKVPPISLRHFLLHCLCLQARRVEDVCVIGAPKFLGGVLGWRVAFVGAGRKGQLGRIPMRATIGREDRPAHAGEAAHEKGRVAFDNEVRGLEPGYIALVVAFADLPEADEGAHLVDVAPDGFLHRLEASDVGVGGDLQKLRFVSHPPKHPVEHGKALGIPVAEYCFSALHEFTGNGEGGFPYSVILGLVPRDLRCWLMGDRAKTRTPDDQGPYFGCWQILGTSPRMTASSGFVRRNRSPTPLLPVVRR